MPLAENNHVVNLLVLEHLQNMAFTMFILATRCFCALHDSRVYAVTSSTKPIALTMIMAVMQTMYNACHKHLQLVNPLDDVKLLINAHLVPLTSLLDLLLMVR